MLLQTKIIPSAKVALMFVYKHVFSNMVGNEGSGGRERLCSLTFVVSDSLFSCSETKKKTLERSKKTKTEIYTTKNDYHYK